MGRRLATTCVRLLPIFTYLALTAGCGGDSSVGVTTPPPPPPPGPAVSGTVLLPSGSVALAQPSTLERVATLIVNEALALSGNVRPVGRNVPVDLVRLLGPTGTAQSGSSRAFTNDQG